MLTHKNRVATVEGLLEPDEKLQCVVAASAYVRAAVRVPPLAIWVLVMTIVSSVDLSPLESFAIWLVTTAVLWFPLWNPERWAIAMTDRNLLLVRLGRIGRRDRTLDARLPRATDLSDLNVSLRRVVALQDRRLELGGPRYARRYVLTLAEQARSQGV